MQSHFKSTNIYYLAVAVGQASGHGWANCHCPKVSHKTAIHCRPRMWFHLMVWWRRIHFQDHSYCYNSVSCWLLAGWSFRSLAPEPLSRIAQNTKAGFLQRKQESKTGCVRQKLQSLWNQFSEEHLYHFCHILSSRSESPDPIHTEGGNDCTAWFTEGQKAYGWQK